MNGLIVIIVCIALSVFCYKKMANRCRVKGRGTLTTFFISLSSSSLVFLVSMIIVVANFFPEAESESGKVSNVKEEKDIKKTVATVKIEKSIKQTQSSGYGEGNPYYDDTDFIEGWTNIRSLYGKGRNFINVSGRYSINKISLPSDDNNKQFYITYDKHEAVEHSKAVHRFQVSNDNNRANNTEINYANIETKSGLYIYTYHYVNGKAWLSICRRSEPNNCGVIDKTNAWILNGIFKVIR
ncbi:hypothetical protein GKR58_09080 [Yersinia pseudotuberculosis]|uniref:hypothetical protein n=1 Tax=Yersinia pseudotuberculosis TaxID=633 RepID=UPI001A9D2D42|nr:hypothetical protein [Yersinia pseudotuberculosis]MBO1630394.1 hypothetical protein [Yersinia pseudotuberculosis]